MKVFLTSPWIPAEWIRAHGLQPCGSVWAESFQRGRYPLSAGVCALAEATVKLAEASKHSAVIFSTACDQLRRGFDEASLRSGCRAFLFNLPSTWQSATAAQMFRAELERLGEYLLTIGGRAPSPGLLQQEMAQADAIRTQLRQCASTTCPREFARAVERFHREGVFSPPQPTAPTHRIPLALVGGPFLSSHWRWLDAIEACGARVVLNATETGERSLSPSFAFEARASDPFEVLLRGYLDNIVDVFQRPNTRLYSWLKGRLASRHVRGIVLWHYTGCDLWRAEAQTFREVFGLPVLLLEASEEAGAAPRELTRLQAFVETLK